jgi:carboxylesterase type B
MPSAGPGNIVKNIAGTSSATQVAAATYLRLSQSLGIAGTQLIDTMKANSSETKGRQGSFKKMITLSNAVSANTNNSAAADAAAKLAAEKAAADAAAKLAAEKAAKAAALKIEVEAGLAEAEKQYAIDLKAAQDKLAAAKAAWMAKLNG